MATTAATPASNSSDDNNPTQAYHHTPREFRVKESPVTPGKYWVVNPLDHVQCVHTTYQAALVCAAGGKCARGYYRNH